MKSDDLEQIPHLLGVGQAINGSAEVFHLMWVGARECLRPDVDADGTQPSPLTRGARNTNAADACSTARRHFAGSALAMATTHKMRPTTMETTTNIWRMPGLVAGGGAASP